MSKIIHKCIKCSNYSEFQDDEYMYFRSQDDNLFTDDTPIIRKKLFLRCPHCYAIMDRKITFFFSRISWRQIALKRKKDEDENIYAEKKKIFRTRYTNAKAIVLNLMEYYDLLSKNDLDKEQELYVRVQILVLENDKRRETYSIYYNNNELDNFKKLEKLLDIETGLFLTVEVKRYLKKFDEAMEQLKLLYNILADREIAFEDKFESEKNLIESKNIYVSSFALSDKAKENSRKRRS